MKKGTFEWALHHMRMGYQVGRDGWLGDDR
jgi:hypothetical protein